MKSVSLSVLPNYVVWFVGVDVEFVLPCRSDPLGRYGDESEAILSGAGDESFFSCPFAYWLQRYIRFHITDI